MLEKTIAGSDLVIAVKPVPASMGIVEPLARRLHKPLIVDIDDPDLPPLPFIRLAARQILKPRKYWADTKIRLAVDRYPHIVSNPVLQNWHGGMIIPHARSEEIQGEAHTRTAPVIAFVGTNHPHKGLPEVREAVRATQNLGTRLVVTDTAPDDARVWEEWRGRTTFEEGRSIVNRSDVVLLPSHPDPWSEGQLPAKLIDAMMAGRAIAVTDVGPMRWALGDGGLIVPPRDIEALVNVIKQFASPEQRVHFGARARARAVSEFGEAVNAKRFVQICEDAVQRSARAREGSR
ncbi:glycosyltransferase family 4 protein [Microbacterium arabinogalactanolyticum]|uniref:glycosyltransferase family 4 protein n=1 Tax=Microbacterium arabinogalactanolyticum TaxID=69365 RepID=UPI0025554E8E|nr:glycosyltransferase [Microbacterium arabinogalactanolyticum]